MQLPETVKYDLQPYGTVTLANLRLSPNPYNERETMCFDLTGDVIEGTERAFLFGHVSHSKASGSRTIHGIRFRELERGTHGDGVIVRVAM